MNLFDFDKSFMKILVGTDEAGRGPAAGGVFASAVFINDFSIEKELIKLNDSKKLTKKVREELFDIILENTINHTVCIEVDEIERINILNSSLKGMKIACENVINKLISCHSELVSESYSLETKELVDINLITIVDGNKLIKNYEYPQQFIIKGDGKSASIAAASILAKVSRDRYMEKLDEEFPVYNWRKNAGYLTKEHQDMILKHGVTKYHRKSFLKNLLNPEPKQLSLI